MEQFLALFDDHIVVFLLTSEYVICVQDEIKFVTTKAIEFQCPILLPGQNYFCPRQKFCPKLKKHTFASEMDGK